MKKVSILCVALCIGLSTTSAFARGGGMGGGMGDGLGMYPMPVTGGAFGSSAAAPGTNSLGTALSTNDFGSGRRTKGPLLGTGSAAIARDNAKVAKALRSICRGC